MSESSAPYFYHQRLKNRFARHLQQAVDAVRITAAQRLWLQRLVEDSPLNDNQPLQPLPRIDRLVTDTGRALGVELAAAWVISDPSTAGAPVFLDTLSGGIERFADRASLSAELNTRHRAEQAAALLLETQHVEGDPFIQRMATLIDVQVRHLDTLAEQLDSLPTLRTALGTHLQHQVDRLIPDNGVDVFDHVLQLRAEFDPGDIRVTGTLSLVDAALHDLGVDSGAGDSVQRQFLAADGTELNEVPARPWRAALTEAGNDLALHFEGLLDQYWNSRRADGASVHQFATGALADTFVHEVLCGVVGQPLEPDVSRALGELARDCLTALAPARCKAFQLSVLSGGESVPKLSGMFLLEFQAVETPGLYLFSAFHGLQHFTDQGQLQAHFDSAEGLQMLTRCTSLDEHAGLAETRRRLLRLDPITQPLFPKMVDSIIALQKRNLRHVLRLPAIHPLRMPVRVDDALDIRYLFDRRLMRLHDAWRWSSGADRFEHRWARGLVSVQRWAEQMNQVSLPPTASWYEHLASLDQFLERHCQVYEGVSGCMRHALNRYLNLGVGQALDARDLWLRTSTQSGQRLISLALQRLGHAETPLPDGSWLAVDLPATASGDPQLPSDLLELILDRVRGEFAGRYEQHLRRFLNRPLRWLNCQLRPALTDEVLRDSILRLEVSVERRLDELSAAALDIFQQALDRPIASLRTCLGEQQVEINQLQLTYDPGQPALQPGDVLVLCQPARPGLYVLWSLCDGLTEHDSLVSLEQAVARRLSNPEVRDDWLKLFDDAERLRLQTHLQGLSGVLHLTARLRRIDGHFIRTQLLGDTAQRCAKVRQSFDRLVRRQPAGDVLRDVIREDECDDRNRPLLDRIGMTLEVILSNALLPPWMQKASLGQLLHLSGLIQNWYVACQSGEDFLDGIPEPRDYAHERLHTRLQADFPGVVLDPDHIGVTITHYTAAPVALGETPQGIAAATRREHTTLIQYAISRFASSQDGLISVSGSGKPGQHETLSLDYLRHLIRDLDVAAGYRQLLARRFAPSDEGYLKRLKSYARQVPPMELLRAYAMRVREELSEEGFRFMEAVLSMPDGLGRLPVLERDIIISPLRLRAGPERVADTVLGAFIVAPRVPQPGPWLLYVLFNADLVIQEYPDQQALLTDIHTSANLQTFILGRLEPDVRKRYANGGFMEPHLPFSAESDFDLPWASPGPVSLEITPLQGNALHALFDSTGQLLQWWFRQLSVTNAEDDREASRFLWSLGAEQMLALLPGRLGAVVALWQTRGLLHASVTDVVHEHWGKAASELLAAVGVLMTSRRAGQEGLVEPASGSDPQAGAEPGAESEAESAEQGGDGGAGKSQSAGGLADPPLTGPELGWGAGVPAFGWSKGSLTPELWSRLRPLQVPDVALNTLNKDPLLNAWQDPANGQLYAPIGGAVYRIGQDESGWRIVGDKSDGPRIRLEDHHWQLDLATGLRGGGGMVTSLNRGLINAEVEAEMIVEARGINEIRSRFRTRARDIVEAHDLARRYLENCLDNLNFRGSDGQPHARVTAILKEFFEWPQPPQSLYEAVRFNTHRLYGALMDNSLSPHDSDRFVVGTRRSRVVDTTAFTFVTEPEKRIYLTEKFFRNPTWYLKPHVVSRGDFNVGTHYRATVLLHELTHLYCGSEDIAYLDAHMPFIDVLDTSSLYRRTLNDELASRHRGLSYQTPRVQLFSIQHSNGAWKDLSSRDGKGKRKVLELTGKPTLEAARDAFYGNPETRSAVILANADSIALLVTTLGRERMAN